jgi:hypothetical protein
MDDEHIETILRHYRVVDPPAALGMRCVRPPHRKRAWPWALAAAVLLATIVAIELANAALLARVSLPDVADAFLEFNQ